jgi:uncharacterized protein DUF1493
MSTDLAERVVTVIARQTGCPQSRLQLQTDLWDLGVDGDDAHDLLLRLGGEFQINLQKMQFCRHFGPETGFNPLAVFLPRWWRWRRERIPVTVADLVEAARTRAWPIRYSEGISA